MTETAHAPTHTHTAGRSPSTEKMPGHVLLANLGKRVLRPGGSELTEHMLAELDVDADDDVVELAPGRGATTPLALARRPRSYTGIEADPAWAARLAELFAEDSAVEMRHADAGSTGLEDGAANVVFGEAMLTMHSLDLKRRIVTEACRILRSGGRYGIHELCILPDDASEETKAAIRRDLSLSIHVGARPLTAAEWHELLDAAAMEVTHVELAPMHLLEPRRVVRDEGLVQALAIAGRALRDRAALRRVLDMRRMFRRHDANLAAVAIVAVKR